VLRDASGDYASAWIAAGLLCFFAAVMSVRIKPPADAADTRPALVRAEAARPS
jgi:hypothetical protein